jgi:hypothetical protein
MTVGPTMRPGAAEFMALEGLIQWTESVIAQAERLRSRMMPPFGAPPDARRAAMHALHYEADFFVTAASRLLAYRKWIGDLGLCSSIDFSEIDKFNNRDTRDLRNMREHGVEYFQGAGDNQARWMKETPVYAADASSMINSMIGGRLDFEAFAHAAATLLPALLKEPIPRVTRR